MRRPEFLPPPLQLGDVSVLAGHQDGAGTARAPGGGQLDCRPGVQGEGGGERDDQRTGGYGGSLLGPLALPPADLVLRPLDLPPQGQPVALQPPGGHRQRSELALQDPGAQRVEGPEGLITPPRPPETNVFWSEKVRREVEGGVQTGQNGAGQPAQPSETARPSEAAQRAGGTAAAQVGESFAESLRVLELPRLSENTTALSLGDWLAVIDPIMSDLSSTSGVWWQLIVGAAQDGYRQWILSGPLDRLRLRPPVPAEASKWPRTEQRAVTMLLACLPEGVRRDLIASRRLSTVEIIYKLLITYQPGGPQERTVLLKDITEDRLGNNPSLQEVLNTLRMWRRNVNRANELKVTLPDTLVIVGVLTKWAEHISRLGGAQTAFRVATLRQDLKLDNRPDADQVMYFAEALQAEIEQVALSRPSTTLSSTSSSSDVKKKEVPKTASLRTGGDSSARCYWRKTKM